MSDEYARIVSDLAAELRAVRRERDDLQREVLVLRGAQGKAPTPPPPLIPRAIGRLTARQARVLLIIADYMAARGMPPSLRHIGSLMGIRSTNGVNDHLRALERKGAIFKHEPDNGQLSIARGIGLTEEGRRLAETMRNP